MIFRRERIWLLSVLVVPTMVFSWLYAQSANRTIPTSKQQVLEIATDAYIYGYPIVTMEMTRRVMTNVAKPEDGRAPMGQFALMRAYPDATFRDVTAPNADTLYSVAWLDLAKEPYLFKIPDTMGRYYLMPMLDAWTNVFQVPGKRTTGTAAQQYAITGPGWRGQLPAGTAEYRSPTNLVWILGRTYCTGTPEDYKKVHAFQDGLSLAPLSACGKPYAPPPGQIDPSINMKTPVRDQVNGLDAGAYFKLMAELMKTNPPAPADAPILAEIAQIGIEPGRDFDIRNIDPDIAKALQDIPKTAIAKMMAKSLPSVNGWTVTLKTGAYGTDYLNRAFTTAIGLGANRPEDAVYPTSEADANGQLYDGGNQYRIHFGKGELPPVNGFWSLTMYNDRFFFASNPLDRYTLSPRNKLAFNPDGSLDLYLQAANPGPVNESNWLPAPAGRFILMLRLYWPKETPPSVLDGTWKPPAVEKVR